MAVPFFWISLGLVTWCYAGYGIVLFILNHMARLFRPRKHRAAPQELLPVTLVITAYNEEKILEQKILNTAAINYPPGLLTVIFITDGSTDQSPGLVRQYPFIKLMHQPERQGKYAAIKRAMREVKTPVVVFSDANTMLNKDCIQRIIPHYAEPSVGGVAGEKKIRKTIPVETLGKAEGLYWKYESFLKKQDAGFHTVVGAAGELFSIRTALFKSLDDELILDDFVISMYVCLSGYKIAYEPSAFATESPSLSLKEEEKRKVRISAGAYQSVGYLKNCLNFFRYPLLSFQFISRRLFRWVLCPLLIPVILFTNVFIVANSSGPALYSYLLGGQELFYLAAFIGWWLVLQSGRAGLLTIPFYFVFMNYCLVKGFFRYLRGRQTVLWEKSLRQVMEQAP